MSEAIFGFLGVLVGSFIPWIKDELRERRNRERHATYLAARVVCILDEYAQKCVEVAEDHGAYMGQGGQDDTLTPQVAQPDPPDFPDDVDWKSIDSRLMYRLLSLPSRARDTERYIAGAAEHAYAPDYEEAFEARQCGYAALGIEALELSEALRDRHSLPPFDHDKWNPDWDPRAYLESAIQKIDKRRQGRSFQVQAFDDGDGSPEVKNASGDSG